MSTSVLNPTPYGDVNAIMRELLASVQGIIGPHFQGMYLYGSLALGDFDPHTSDIDFLVTTDTALPAEMVTALQALHVRLTADYARWGRDLEGVYIPLAVLRCYDRDPTPYPHIERGERLRLEPLGPESVITRYILREHGIVLAGPPPAPLIDPIAPDDLRAAAAGIMREWWAPMLKNPVHLQHFGYRAYAISTMCRVLYTMQHGTIVSKPVAGRWARSVLDARLATLVDKALAGPAAWPETDFQATLDLIAYTVAQSAQWAAGHTAGSAE